LTSLLLVAAGFVFLSACNVGDVQVTNTPLYSLNGQSASFDVIQIDQKSHRLYVSDRTDKGIDVFDISSTWPRFVETIAMPSSPNGLAIAPDLGRLFVGMSSGVAIVDIDGTSQTRNTVIKQVATGGPADLLEYAKPLLFVSSSDGSLTEIDATSAVLKKQFKLGHPLEQPRYNPTDGKLYATSPGTNALLQVDPNEGTVAKEIPLPKCQPGGLAINPRSNQALVTCRSSVTSVDLNNGKAQVFTQITGGDVVTYVPQVDRFFVAAPKNKPASVVGIFGGEPVAFITSVVTSGGGNSAAYDETNGIVYTPDTRINKAGLNSFRLPASDQLSTSFVMSLVMLGIFAAFIGLVLILLARSADPIRRRAPAPKTPVVAGSQQVSRSRD
jgi:sugar lactone lactonase YvrE